ncbi:hypothetical protein DRJ27_04385, partial [Candidatus Acetothermia bacterium]
LWEIALGLVLYQLGLSFRKTAEVLGLLGKEVSHVAVWYWNKKVGEAGIKLHQGPLPPVIVVDETWVKVGGKEAWIYVALDSRTLKVVFLEPFFVRDEANTNAFLEHLVEAYGEWPKEVITDGGPWYRAAFSFWQVEGKITWRVVRGGERSVLEGFFGEFLKRRIKDFDRYFPTKKGLDSLRRWLWTFAWLHNLIVDGCF